MYLVTIREPGNFDRTVHSFWNEEMNATEVMSTISSPQEPQLWQRVKGTCENCEDGDGKYKVRLDEDYTELDAKVWEKKLCKDCREKVITAMKGENNDQKASS